MLKVNLGQLDREGSVTVSTQLDEADETWHGTDLRWSGPVDVRLAASFAGTGEVVARGEVAGTLRNECTRCLKAVETSFRSGLTLVFVEGEDSEGGAYGFEPAGSELDMSEAVREEIVLAVHPYVVCDPECRGLCPRCGTNLNEGACDCTDDELDPRWAALRALQDE